MKHKPRLTYANVVSTICLFLLLGGGAYAAFKLPKNSVGSKQLKKNSVTTAKIKNGAVTGAKINLSTLGTVPSASHAGSADTATTASSLVAPEPIHVIGASGEPGFENGFVAISTQGVGFFKDHECIVHLSGAIEGMSGKIAFTLPPGYRPSGEYVQTILSSAPDELGWLEVFAEIPGPYAGLVVPYAQGGGKHVFGLNGVTFRATSC
jgi:hypothetical protein